MDRIILNIYSKKCLENMISKTIFSLSVLFLNISIAQPTYTANDKVVDYGVPFGYGVNPGYYGDASSGSGFDREGVSYDVALAQLARQVGINNLRPSLPAYFFLQFGNSTNLGSNNFEIRSPEFAQYLNLGINYHTAFIGDATDHQDGDYITTFVGNQYRNIIKYSGCDKNSYEFKNMYEPIWDTGENGTPVNDNNYYALYVYKMATKYKGYIKTYEVVNEIDFKGFGTVDPDGKAGSNSGDNWYDRNPRPCELLNWRAPIFSYIRMLRISYEVVKTVDPNAFIAVGGIGYESFLDAVLRNTDNPTDGSVDATKYPVKGGAYFDVLSYHYYPQFDLKQKTATGDNVYPFVQMRFSDEAAQRTADKKDKMQATLAKYKYDGASGNFPLKHFIITETNIPRKTYSGVDYIGSDDAQRNYAVKVMVKAQKKGIKQVCMFKLGESNDITDDSNKEGHEGLFENLTKAKRTSATKTSAGKALQTLTAILDGLTYDDNQTIAISLPSVVDGAAFKNSFGNYIYVLWAKTTVDNSEIAAASFTFPSSMNIASVNRAGWDYALTSSMSVVSSSTVVLTGAPSYFTDAAKAVPFKTTVSNVTAINTEKSETYIFKTYPNPFTKDLNFSFHLAIADLVSIELISLRGDKSTSICQDMYLSGGEQSLTFDNIYLPSGLYLARLSGKNTGLINSTKLIVE
jgi:hypothetical protein